MPEHLIEYVARDRTGITAVVTTTGVIDASVVIENIRAGHAGYYVAADSWTRARVRSLTALGTPYLFANWDGSKRNNLHDLAFRTPTRVVPTMPPTPGQTIIAVVAGVVETLFGRRRRTRR